VKPSRFSADHSLKPELIETNLSSPLKKPPTGKANDGGQDGSTEQKISMVLGGKVPAIEAMKYIAGLYEQRYRIHGRTIRFEPIHLPETLVKGSFRLRPGFAPDEYAKLNPDGSYDLRSALEARGVYFPVGGWAKYWPKTRHLEVFLTEDEVVRLLKDRGLVDTSTWQDRVSMWIGL
jgi:hypothetical protein